MKQKLIVLSLLFVMFTTFGGTIAFTSAEQNSITQFSNENVDINQIECERIKDSTGNYVSVTQDEINSYKSNKLKEFTQEQEIMPAYYSEGIVKYNNNNQLIDSSVKNVTDKLVYVENIGDTDLYYRTVIAVECPEGFDISLVHLNINDSNKFLWQDIGYKNIGGKRYFIKVATYLDVLTPTEISIPSLLQVYLDPNLQKKDVDLIGDTLEILVKTQATKVEEGIDSLTVLNKKLGNMETTNPWAN